MKIKLLGSQSYDLKIFQNIIHRIIIISLQKKLYFKLIPALALI